MTARGAGIHGKRILFWTEYELAGLVRLAAFMGIDVNQGRPQSFVRNDIPYDDRMVVARALDRRSTMNPTGGQVLMSYMGHAECRMCGLELGCADFFGYGFVWPEKAEHYVIEHKVWTPDCDLLLAAVRGAR